MAKICVIGTGYVGLVTGTCFSDMGHRVTCLDINEKRIEKLNNGIMPIYEPGLKQIVDQNVDAGRLNFTTSYQEALEDAEFAFIAVGTPSSVDGDADMQYVKMAAETIASHLDHPIIIVNKSTVPVGTGDWVSEIIKDMNGGTTPPFYVVSNPEFLREGSAVNDFMEPDRVVLGSTNREAAEKVADLYEALRAPIMITDLRTAEMIKYASNAFLATRISFINEIANICESLGADVKEVARGMGMDKRIGPSFLDAGLGWGGSCFPKDVKALAHMAETRGSHPQLLQAVMDINQNQRKRAVQKVEKALGGLKGKTIGLLGLSFKPNTDDTRDAPALDIARMLLESGAVVQAFDPQAMEVSKKEIPQLQLRKNPYETAEAVDALILATEWNEFKSLDFERIKANMKGNVILDGRNIWDGTELHEMGFTYFGMGVPQPGE
ncbi:MAG TPA: UDP-glucose 6-dehydrogenase [Anaerolineaceae bacterium]|nr:MAG: UDP-glucose 6-dehydrogenase [Anaerolineaceae bacterium 46_22]HAF49240.1 UDP-glucose 6-dehydrogenase [Anaerolineaceae bacterium]